MSQAQPDDVQGLGWKGGWEKLREEAQRPHQVLPERQWGGLGP